MELDELKQGWAVSAKQIQIPPRNIQSLIISREYGPVAKLRNRFRKAMILVPVIIAIALSRLPHHHSLAFFILFPFLLAFAISMMIYFYYNYQLLGKVQTMDVTVKENLLKQVTALEKGVRFRLIFTRATAVVFIALLEILTHFGKEIPGWNDKSLLARLTLYAVVFASFYLLTHLAVKYRYSQNISYLKKLVNELE